MKTLTSRVATAVLERGYYLLLTPGSESIRSVRIGFDGVDAAQITVSHVGQHHDVPHGD